MNDLRQTFPRGLVQPEGAFRSSADALLLAFFGTSLLSAPGSKTQPYFVELGTGCGTAACAVALRAPAARGVGVDIHPALIKAARHNVTGLDLEAQLRMEVADVADLNFLRQICGTGEAHMVLANPPYRKEGTGRPSAQPMRQAALQGDAETLHVFCRAARMLLCHHGYFCMVFLASRLGDLLVALRSQELGLRTLRCVHPRPDRPAALVLAAARKNAAEDTQILPPLHLYAAAEGDEYTQEAREILFKER